MDSVPLVAITGQVGRPAMGKDSFQETNVMGMTLPFTKHSFLVEDPDELYPTMRRAFEIARTGRPGPVLIDVPKDVLQNTMDWEWPDTLDLPGYKPTMGGPPTMIKDAARMMLAARSPSAVRGGDQRQRP